MYAMRRSAQHPIFMRIFDLERSHAQLQSINAVFCLDPSKWLNMRLSKEKVTWFYRVPDRIFLSTFFYQYGLLASLYLVHVKYADESYPCARNHT